MGLIFTLFLRASLFVPSILIWYWLPAWLAVMMTPDDVHFPFCTPLICCSRTFWPGFSLGSGFVCSDHLIPSLFIFSQNALSLSSAVSWKSSCMLYLPPSISSLICMRSLRCLPYRSCAGVLSRSLSGVFLYSISAIDAFSPLSLYPVPTASCRILFIDFTPVSALRFACGL